MRFECIIRILIEASWILHYLKFCEKFYKKSVFSGHLMLVVTLGQAALVGVERPAWAVWADLIVLMLDIMFIRFEKK